MLYASSSGGQRADIFLIILHRRLPFFETLDGLFLAQSWSKACYELAGKLDNIDLTSGMALVRILVDGYSLLHGWPELAPGQPRHSSAAREQLLHRLRQYRDAIGTPITVIFDGTSSIGGEVANESTPEMEILYSRSGRTADDLIERATHRLSAYGEVLVVTDDRAEREVVSALGAMTSSCAGFIQSMESAEEELRSVLTRINRRERSHFQQP